MSKPRARPPIIFTYLFAALVLSIAPALTFLIPHLFAFVYRHVSVDRQLDISFFVHDRVHFLLYLAIFHALLNWLLLAFFIYFSRKPLRSGLNLRPLRISIISLAVYTLGILAMGRLLIYFMYLIHLRSHTLESITTLLRDARTHAPLLAFSLFSIVGPITEEFVFRGYIQPRLIRRHGPLLGILITSIFFGIYHYDVVQGIYAAGIGLFIGAISYRSSSILPAILLHIINNSFSTLQIYYPAYAIPTSLPILMGAAIIFPASLWLLASYRPNPPLFPTAQHA